MKCFLFNIYILDLYLQNFLFTFIIYKIIDVVFYNIDKIKLFYLYCKVITMYEIITKNVII